MTTEQSKSTDEETKTVEIDREVYTELVENVWVASDELSEEIEFIKFFKNGLPEGWKDTGGSAVAGASQAGTGVWIPLDDHGTSEDWEAFLEEVETAREHIEEEGDTDE